MRRSIAYIILLILAVFVQPVNGQQLPMFSQYAFNGFILNPAMAGYDGYTSLNTTVRQQWLGLEGAPKTIAASWQTRLLQQSFKILENPFFNRNILKPSTKGRIGLGGYVLNDANGSMSKTGIQLAYGYHIIIDNSQLSFGLAGKLFQYHINSDDFHYGEAVDPLIDAGFKEVAYSPDADAGILFTNEKIYIGASVNNLFQSNIYIGGDSLDYRIKRHYWFMSGYRLRLNQNLEIEPNMLFKSSESWIPQLDLGAKLYVKEFLWTGFAYRSDNSIISMIGIKLESLFFAYAFDYSFSSIQRFSYGNHELSIAYKIGDAARRYRWLRRY